MALRIQACYAPALSPHTLHYRGRCPDSSPRVAERPREEEAKARHGPSRIRSFRGNLVPHSPHELHRKGFLVYSNEEALVEDFLHALREGREALAVEGYAQEFDYRAGRTDIIAVGRDGHVFAFELKLSDWRTALIQAHRNTSFAHQSYVVLPIGAAYQALRFAPEFEKRGIGILGMSHCEQTALLEAVDSDPVLHWLTNLALKAVHEAPDPIADE